MSEESTSSLTLAAVFSVWVGRLRALATHLLEVVALELRLAALSVSGMLLFTIMSAMLLTTAWLALFGAALLWLVDHGLSWPGALILVAVGNTALAIIGLLGVYRLSDNVGLNAFRILLANPEPLDESDPAAAQDPSAGPPSAQD